MSNFKKNNLNRCHLCNNTSEWGNSLIKVKRWFGDVGVWECENCRELDDLDSDIDAHEARKRQRIAEENEY